MKRKLKTKASYYFKYIQKKVQINTRRRFARCASSGLKRDLKIAHLQEVAHLQET